MFATVESFANCKSSHLEGRGVVLILTESVSSPSLTISSSRKVSQSVGLFIDQLVEASRELRSKNVVTIAITVQENDVILL